MALLSRGGFTFIDRLNPPVKAALGQFLFLDDSIGRRLDARYK